MSDNSTPAADDKHSQSPRAATPGLAQLETAELQMTVTVSRDGHVDVPHSIVPVGTRVVLGNDYRFSVTVFDNRNPTMVVPGDSSLGFRCEENGDSYVIVSVVDDEGNVSTGTINVGTGTGSDCE